VATMTGAELLEFIRKGSRGRFFCIEFVKRTTGELRPMLCRYGVRKYVTGVGMAFNPNEQNLVVVWDVKKKAYRMIPLEGVVRVKVRGEWQEVLR